MKYFFIHTPKTSGTTFTEVLKADSRNNVSFFYPPSENMLDFEARIKEGPKYNAQKNPNWIKSNFIVGHFTYGIHKDLDVKDFKYIGVFRDPIDHYISMYKNLLRMDHSFQNAILPKGVSIENFLDLEYTHNFQTFFLSGLSLTEIKKDNIKAFEVCKTNIERDFVGLYPTDNFDKALFYFKEKIGLNPILVANRNVSKAKESINLNSKIIAKIKEINKADYLLYNYLTQKFNEEINKVNLGMAYQWYMLKKRFK